MGWTCQHDLNGFCKLLQKPCIPGMKGCVIKKSSEYTFSTGNYEQDKKVAEEKAESIDFAALARSN